jgi:hypothetical protein
MNPTRSVLEVLAAASAFTQLRCSPLMLLLVTGAMALLFLSSQS